ncbi:hypothetical protein THAOC_02395 [Thalassiosira oceanica]|uniref:Uncharacterized protein n=1 Tax=Thalassiosira oceanica TaxID=159749 RepID=K0TFN8_THAOC|nr:hypothetical protein THAOC_02395 [Thalassiosira oceanica]|eukprot:EJK75869.1 hypothetical protein THAOC_02395 [Thalassiosira oceanica]
MNAVIGAPGEAMEELDSPYRRCAGRADRARQGAVVALQIRRATYAQGRISRVALDLLMNFFLCDFLRPASGVRGNDGVCLYPACSAGSAECPLYADGSIGSIGSVRGLRRPQTTIDASSVFGLSAPMCSRPSHAQFFLSHVSLLHATDVAGN